jgi:uncharacterized protein
MNIVLSVHEARILACLVEKQITTPEQYPLSLNAITNACNQKSNRDPMLDLAENEVQSVIDSLSRKHLVLERSGFGSRVPKYQQRFCNTEFSVLQFTPQERAIICELMLRGPQTPGELRTRAARMAEITDVTQVEAALEALRTRESGPMVQKLAREAGRRDSRYAHLFSGPIAEPLHPELSRAAADVAQVAIPAAATLESGLLERLSRLEEEVRGLREELDRLKSGAKPGQ